MNFSEKHRQKLKRISSCLFKPFVRARLLRSDDSGNVMLLSGMMAFLFTIFALISTNTSQAIYNRIIAQNSVDAAADAAALWQARGCNMLQNLNNYHYEANSFFAKTEANALNACSLAALLEILRYLPYVGTAAGALKDYAVCPACRTAPVWDDAQNTTASAILSEQEWVATTVPWIAWAAASDAAQGAGADATIASFAAWLNQWPAVFGVQSPPAFNGVGSLLTAASSSASTVMNYLGIGYAFPLKPTSLSLGVTAVAGHSSPWKFKRCSTEIGLGKLVCGLDDPTLNRGPESQYAQNWGWDGDKYYQGRPGYMTWVVGKTNQTTVLGFLRWLNPSPTQPAAVGYWLNQSGVTMYNGSVTASASLEIPAFIAVASSQVDGKPGTEWKGLVENSSDNYAYPYLIPVYIPGIGAGTSIGIFH